MRFGPSALLSLTLLQGCASTTDIDTRYLTDTAVPPAPSLLLVARTPEADTRARWESACADELGGGGLTLVRSHDTLPVWYEAGNERLLAWARDNAVDAVLVAEITGLLLAPPQVPQPNYMQSERAIGDNPGNSQNWGFFFGRNPDQVPAPPEVHEVEMQLLGNDGSARWTGVTATHEANDLEAIAGSQCKALKKTLSGLRLVP